MILSDIVLSSLMPRSCIVFPFWMLCHVSPTRAREQSYIYAPPVGRSGVFADLPRFHVNIDNWREQSSGLRFFTPRWPRPIWRCSLSSGSVWLWFGFHRWPCGGGDDSIGPPRARWQFSEFGGAVGD